MGCRKIVRVLEVFARQLTIQIPHQTTVRQWVMRNGCYSLQSPLEQSNDWIAIGDITISLGKMKCLAILGVRMSSLEKKDDMTLSHTDVIVLGLHPTEKSDSDFVKKALEKAADRVGGSLKAAIFDRGSDVKKGARLFQEQHPGIKILHDISHKLSNIVERTLKDDPLWIKYTQQLNMTRRRVLQTEFAALMPAKQREKARFMDIGFLVNWPERILKCKIEGDLCDIPEERYEEYFGWINGFIHELNQWGFMVGTVELIKDLIRINGLSEGVYLYLKTFFEEAPIDGERLKAFVTDGLNAVWEEVEKLDEDQTIICSIEVIESVFGKYKAINEGIHGVTGNVLGICTFVGPEHSEHEIKEIMEKCSVKNSFGWIKENVGTSLAGLRKQYFPGYKRTKFDNIQEGVLCN